jgi:hypothetical protein
MPQLIKPNDVKVLTKDGEVKISITLDLNINLNDGRTQVQINEIGLSKPKENLEDKTVWQIPDFTPGEKINFGK